MPSTRGSEVSSEFKRPPLLPALTVNFSVFFAMIILSAVENKMALKYEIYCLLSSFFHVFFVFVKFLIYSKAYFIIKCIDLCFRCWGCHYKFFSFLLVQNPHSKCLRTIHFYIMYESQYCVIPKKPEGCFKNLIQYSMKNEKIAENIRLFTLLKTLLTPNHLHSNFSTNLFFLHLVRFHTNFSVFGGNLIFCFKMMMTCCGFMLLFN